MGVFGLFLKKYQDFGSKNFYLNFRFCWNYLETTRQKLFSDCYKVQILNNHRYVQTQKNHYLGINRFDSPFNYNPNVNLEWLIQENADPIPSLKDCQENISSLFSSKEHFLENEHLNFIHLFETVQVSNVSSFQSIGDVISTLHSLNNLTLQFPFLIYPSLSFEIHQETIQAIFDIFSNVYFSCRKSTYSFVGSYVLSFVNKFENLCSMLRYHGLSR
jgi:hypothetical protein